MKAGINGTAPFVRAEGLRVLMLGEGEGLNQSLANVGEGHGSFGFDLTPGDGTEEASQCASEIASRHVMFGEVRRYILAGLFGDEGLGFLLSMVVAEIQMAGAARSAALAAIGKGESTQIGTVLLRRGRKTANGAVRGHGSLQKSEI